MPDDVKTNQDNEAEEYVAGELAPNIITSSKVFKPDDLDKLDATLQQTIMGIIESCSQADSAARRFNVLQVWEGRHFDRGYQYLEDNKGGWQVVGTDVAKGSNSLVANDNANMYPTNLYAAQGDIISSALCRGDIKVNFSPVCSKEPSDVETADEANKYKHIWYETNCSTALQRDLAGLAWTDPRGVFWTRSMSDKSRFGVVEGEDGQEEIKVVEVTTLHGVLESKLPMMADRLDQMSYAQVFEEVDYALARAAYPWMGDKIKPSWGTFGELEFERIARINTRIGVTGKYMTGTTGIREATMGYTWIRPGMFFDDKIKEVTRNILLENFPSGLFVVIAGKELCCCWDESMDNHLSVGVFTRGFGQNRRALGSSDIPINKRINIWADLWDKFIRGSIAMTLLDDQAFNLDAISKMEATTARFVPVTVDSDRQQTLQSVVGQTPVPSPVAGFLEVFQQYTAPLLQSIDGATPALFGGGEGEDNTVGATQIRLQQALERHGNPWSVMNKMFEEALGQAVLCCAQNGNADINGSAEGIGDITVSPANLKGNFKAKAETAAMIPQSGAQRELRVLAALDFAKQDPDAASMIASPSNVREIVKALHIDDVITVGPADWEDCALEDIDELLESEPLENPEWHTLNDQLTALNTEHDQVKQLATQAVTGGQQLPPEVVQQGQQMESQVNDMQQQLDKTPRYLPSIPIAQDESEDHTTIAATVYAWMGEPEGRALRRKARGVQPDEADPDRHKYWAQWTNVYLYWKGHSEIAATLMANKQQIAPPKVSLAGKLSSDEIGKMLAAAGIQTDGQQAGAPKPLEDETETISRTPYQETKRTVKRRL